MGQRDSYCSRTNYSHRNSFLLSARHSVLRARIYGLGWGHLSSYSYLPVSTNELQQTELFLRFLSQRPLPLGFYLHFHSTNFVDSKGLGSNAALTYTGSQTAASENETKQPIAQLGIGFFYSSSSETAACLKCVPGCASCSDMYTCPNCSSGSLLAGICIASSVSPRSGKADEVFFSLSTGGLAQANLHINKELNIDSAE